MMRSTLATLAVATGALAGSTPFSVPADDARWTVTPRYMRALDVFHGVGCLAGSSGLVISAGLRAELLFNGTQLRLTGIAPPRDTQILMDGEPLSMPPSFDPGAAACVPFAEWAQLDGLMVHNLTIVAPPTGTGRFQFLIANATGIALDAEPLASGSASSDTPPSSSPSPDPHPLPDSSPAAQSQPQSAADSDSPAPSPAARTPHAGLLIAAVLAPLALFLCAGFALYFYRVRNKGESPDAEIAPNAQSEADAKADAKTDAAGGAVKRSRSFKGMHETQFIMVPATVRPEMGTPGVVKV